MIITRTPLRLSLAGGGSDYRTWVEKHSGVVVGGCINKFSYLTVRDLPPYHSFKHRVVYNEIETVNSIDEVKHKAVQACIRYMKVDESQGLEISHLSDLPGRSGTGSSSSFIVGLLNAIAATQGRRMLPNELTQAAICIEQKISCVGMQDQTFAAHGGLNIIRFRPNGEISVLPLFMKGEALAELEMSLMLFFTGVARTSSDVAASYVPGLVNRETEQWATMRLAEDAITAIYRRDWELLGKLVDQSWRIKCSLSDKVADANIHATYVAARTAGAFGGKLTGAGGGGSFLLVVPPEKRQRITAAMTERGCVHIPFKFDFTGSSVIFAGANH
jgi:D-glycero-alpha-D-manno-heptose-7-phosphate kinase